MHKGRASDRAVAYYRRKLRAIGVNKLATTNTTTTPMAPIKVVPYDPTWPQSFQATARRLRALFPPTIPISIEHVGSTSVPGLAAKPILDIDIVVQRADLPSATSVLKAAGYEHRGDQGVPGREAFRLPQPSANEPRVNLYLCVEGVLALRNHLAVRDVLRENADLRDEYAQVKRRLAATQGIDMDAYVEGKSEVLGRILAKGGIGRDELVQIEEVNRDTR